MPGDGAFALFAVQNAPDDGNSQFRFRDNRRGCNLAVAGRAIHVTGSPR